MNVLRKLRKSANLTMKELGDIIGVSESTISLYENGKREPDFTILKNISNYFNVTIDYLLGNDNINDETSVKKGIKIPVLGKVQAGIPIEAIEDIIDYEEITEDMAKKGNYFALQVRGKSMEPRFSEGDVVVVLKQTTAETGDIAIVLVNNNDATIKKIKRTKEGIMLIPLNSAFEPWFYTNEEIEALPVTILGKVVELRAKF